MPYKTISFKLHSPSKRKQNIIDHAMYSYSIAFEHILRKMKDEIHKNKTGSKSWFLKLINNNILSSVNKYEVEPFKDALKLDIAMLLSSYTGRKKSVKKSKYPVTQIVDDDIHKLLCSIKQINYNTLNIYYDKYNKLRPIFFCRYDMTRDFSLLKDEISGKYYAKIYLLNLRNAILNNVKKSSSLVYLNSEYTEFVSTKRKVRYIIIPLETSPWHVKHLNAIENGDLDPKSATLTLKDGEYFLNVNLHYNVPEKIKTSSYMGIVRGINYDLYYSICDFKGETIKHGEISSSLKGINKLHEVSNKVINICKSYNSQIVMTNLTKRNDGLNNEDNKIPISIGDYNKIINFVTYKGEIEGLYSPIIVSGVGIFYTCPVCKTFKYSNRLNTTTFLCVNCGFSSQLQLVGTSNLSRKIINYKHNKVIIYYKKSHDYLHFYSNLLNLKYTCKDDEFALNSFYTHINNYLNNIKISSSSTEKSLLKKLSNTEDIKNLIEFLEE